MAPPWVTHSNGQGRSLAQQARKDSSGKCMKYEGSRAWEDSLSEFVLGLCLVLLRERPEDVDLLLQLLLLRLGDLAVHHLLRPLGLLRDEGDAVRLDLLQDLDVVLRPPVKVRSD